MTYRIRAFLTATVCLMPLCLLAQPKKLAPANPIQKIQPLKPLSGPRPLPPALGTLTLTAPAQGRYQVQGNDLDIRWSKQGTIADPCYDLLLMQGSTVVRQIRGNVCVNGFRWQIPMDLSGADFRILLRTRDGTVETTSQAFPIITRKAQLVVTSFAIEAENPGAKDNRNAVMKLKIQNGGFTKSLPHELVVTLRSEDTGQEASAYFEIGPMAFGDHKTLNKKLTLGAEGTWRYSMKLEPLDSSELYEWGVPTQGDYAVNYLPDLIVCIYESVEMKPMQHGYIWVDVRNKGKAPAEASVLEFWIDGKGTETFAIPPIPANPKSPWTYYRFEMWPTPGTTTYRVTINKNRTAVESKYQNNELTGTIYHYYNLPDEKNTRYHCTDNCETLECAQ